MNINYHISPYPALLENMVAKVYEVDVNGAVAEVDSQTILEKNGSGVPTVGAGHQVPQSISFNGRDRITHEVRLYTASATLLHQYQVQPTENLVTVFSPIKFKIGDGGTYTPAAGDTVFTHPDLNGVPYTEYTVQRNGIGTLFEGEEIADNGSGFDLIQTDDVFGSTDAFIVQRNSQVVANIVNDSVVGKQWGPTSGNANMFVNVSSSVNYAAGTHLRKLIRMSGNSAAFHFTTNPPVGYPFRFTNVGAYSTLADLPKIYFDAATLIEGNTTAAVFDLPYGSTCEFVFDGTSWNKSIIVIGDPVPPAALVIEGRGLFNIGDVPGGGGTFYEINHGLNIVGDYLCFISIKSNTTADHSKDVKVSAQWFHHVTDKPNKFWLIVAELTSNVQNIAVAWMIVKI